MTENNKLYTVIDEYNEILENYTFDNYESAEACAKNQAEQAIGLEIFVVECKRVAKVFVPKTPDPIVTFDL